MKRERVFIWSFWCIRLLFPLSSYSRDGTAQWWKMSSVKFTKAKPHWKIQVEYKSCVQKYASITSKSYWSIQESTKYANCSYSYTVYAAFGLPCQCGTNPMWCSASASVLQWKREVNSTSASKLVPCQVTSHHCLYYMLLSFHIVLMWQNRSQALLELSPFSCMSLTCTWSRTRPWRFPVMTRLIKF